MADHENNTLTTLKLYEMIKGFHGLKKVVYASRDAPFSPKTYDQATATPEDAPVSLFLDSPIRSRKSWGILFQLLLSTTWPSGCESPLPERLWPRRGAGGWKMARDPGHRLEECHSDFIYRG